MRQIMDMDKEEYTLSEQEPLQEPYTIEELNVRIDEAEAEKKECQLQISLQWWRM